jgi:hypothetical protein
VSHVVSVASVLGSTYTCEQVFSHIKQKKLKLCSRFTDMHLHDVMQIGISHTEPNVILLQSKGRPKFHISKVNLGYFYCNVQFRVGHGRDI